MMARVLVWNTVCIQGKEKDSMSMPSSVSQPGPPFMLSGITSPSLDHASCAVG